MNRATISLIGAIMGFLRGLVAIRIYIGVLIGY